MVDNKAEIKKRHGFSLVETIVALLIFTIALLALAQIPALYSKLMSMSVEKENATLHAIHALDYIETLDYDNDIDASLNTSDLADSLDLPSDYNISNFDVQTDSSSKTVSITISKTGGIGKEDVTLTRVVSPFADKTASD